VSRKDEASVNIGNSLLEEGDFEEISTFEGRPVYKGHGFLMYEMDDLHLHLDGVDSLIRRHFDMNLPGTIPDRPEGDTPLDLLVFLSKHSSGAGIESLTVHPPGNLSEAEHGGRSRYLPPSAPLHMAAALRSLYREKKAEGIRDRVSMEVTHHGPAVDSPSFFIEIGSSPGRWSDPLLGRVVARSLLSGEILAPDPSTPIAVGIGGGHYAPRFSDRALRGKFAFGHMVPDHVMEASGDIRGPLDLSVGATPGVTCVFAHRSLKNADLLRDLDEIVSSLGLELVP